MKMKTVCAECAKELESGDMWEDPSTEELLCTDCYDARLLTRLWPELDLLEEWKELAEARGPGSVEIVELGENTWKVTIRKETANG